MFFKNLTIYRFPTTLAGLFPGATADELDNLDQLLADHPLRPCGPLELHSRGFIAPLGGDSDSMVHRLGDFAWITLGGEDKVLPSAVVNAELRKRMKAFEEKTGRPPGARMRKQLKDDVVTELLPRAFAKPARCDAYLDFERGLLVVDSPSRNRADQVVSEIRHAIGSFPALPLNAETAPRAILTAWLAGDTLPDGVALGESCVLEDPTEGGSRVVVHNLDLASDEVRGHLEAGLQCTRLSLTLDDHVAFDMDEDLVVRKLRFLDGAVGSLENTERDDLRAELNARFALMTAETSRLFDVLQAVFQFTVPSDEEPSFSEQGRPARAAAASGENPMAGIETVTISHVAGGKTVDSVTMTGEQFHQATQGSRAGAKRRGRLH